MNVFDDVEELRRALEGFASVERAEGERRYLKSALVHLGVTVPHIRGVAKRYLSANRSLDRDALRALVDALWARDDGVHELRFLAVELLSAREPLLRATDLDMLELRLREARTWALVDPLAITVVGGLVTRFPQLREAMARWGTDGDFWIRRAALLSHLGPLRRGVGDWEGFTSLADRLLEEREFFVRKAIGWVLRETARKRPELVASWLAPRTARTSGVTLREAVKPLAPEARAALLAAYRDRRPAA